MHASHEQHEKVRVPRAAVLSAAAILCLLVLGIAWAGSGRWSSAGWLASAVTSRLFIICGVVGVVSACALVAIGGMLWAAGSRNRLRRRSQDGSAILEFALALPFAMMLVLLMAQSSLLMVGNLCVNYSAYCAARSAIVNVPDDLSPNEPPNVVDSDPTASGKMRRLQVAAVWAVLPVSCSSRDLPEADAQALIEGLESFFERYGEPTPYWVRAHLGRKLRYADEYTTVELEPPAQGGKYAAHEDLRVTVRHTFYMAIPYANRAFSSLAGGDGVALGFGQGEYGMVIRATCRLTNEGEQDYVDIEPFPRPG